MARILITGATGAMGTPLVELLSKAEDVEGYATSRTRREDAAVHWLQGDAKEPGFMRNILESHRFDCIVNFMNYSTAEFEQRAQYILENTEHYVFLSSARVYAENNGLIDEDAPRILDTCRDRDYLARDSYDLAKARQENILNQSGKRNYTIIRPSLTYNDHRMQLTLFELQEWIYRFFDGNSIIFPEEMENIYTTMTFGGDVAAVLARLACNPAAMGETFNVNGGGSATWGEVMKTYASAMREISGKPVRICRVPNAAAIAKTLNRYDQYRLARGISRRFSNHKVERAIGKMEYTTIHDGLGRCMKSYLEQTENVSIPSFRIAAYLDRVAHEFTPIERFDRKKHKAGYIFARMGLPV